MHAVLAIDGPINAGLEIAVALGVVLLLVAAIGTSRRSRPHCRRCGRDARPTLACLATETGSAAPAPCPCGARLDRRGAIRWQTSRRLVTVGALALLLLAIGAAGRWFTLSVAADGLLLTDLRAAEPVVQAVEAYASGTSTTAFGATEWPTLRRLIVADRLTDDQIRRVVVAAGSPAMGQSPDVAMRTFFTHALLTGPEEIRALAAAALIGEATLSDDRSDGARLQLTIPRRLVPFPVSRPGEPAVDTLLVELIAITAIRLDGETVWSATEGAADGAGVGERWIEFDWPHHPPVDGQRLFTTVGAADPTIRIAGTDVDRSTVEVDLLIAAVDLPLGRAIEAAGWTIDELLEIAPALPTYRRTITAAPAVLEDSLDAEAGR